MEKSGHGIGEPERRSRVLAEPKADPALEVKAHTTFPKEKEFESVLP